MQTNGSTAQHTEWIAVRRSDGFSVYDARDPAISFNVSGTRDNPQCDCPEFLREPVESDYRCDHILAVEVRLAESANGNGHGNGSASHTEEPAETEQFGQAVQMLLKRSVSPDGRINSLSIEFACPVNALPGRQIFAKADTMLDLQQRIAAAFLKEDSEPNRSNGNGNGQAASRRRGRPEREADCRQSDAASHEWVEAVLGEIGQLRTRYGQRLYIAVECEGETLKLIGDRRKLGQQLIAAGFPEETGRIQIGNDLNLPCQALIRPSSDGRYRNVEELAPTEASSRRRHR